MKVTLHKSTDGQLHETAKACANRNIELRTLAAIHGVQDNIEMVGFVAPIEYVGTEYVLCVSDVPAFIAANAAMLRKALNESLIAKRKRKAPLKVSAKVVTIVPDDDFEAFLGDLVEATEAGK